MKMIATPSIHRPLLPITIGFMVGLAIGAQWPGQWPVALTIAIMASIFLMRSIRWGRPAILIPLLFCLCVGYLGIQPWVRTQTPPNHVSHFIGQGWWHMEGHVVEAPQPRGRGIGFVMAVTALHQNQRRLLVHGHVSVSASGKRLPQVTCGDTVALTGRLKAIRNFANPGGFDYTQYMKLRGVRARTYARKASLKIIKHTSVTSFQQGAEQWRQSIMERMHVVLGNHDNEALPLLKALILGKRNEITEDMRQRFQEAGVSHVLAISGLHIGMVAAATFMVFRWLFAWIPMMLKYGWTRKGGAVVSMAAVFAYALLAGFSASTQRAAIMVAVVLMSHWVGRRHDWFNVLAVAALIILIIHPPALMSVSFQLSFAAVMMIVMGLHRWAPGQQLARCPWWQRWLQRWFAFLWVSALAIGGTLPLVIYYFHQTSLVGLATNCVVVPLVGMVVVPAGLLGVLFSSISALAAGLLWSIAMTGLHIILWVVDAVASWSWSAVHCVTPTPWEVILYYLCWGCFLGWPTLPLRRWLMVGCCLLWVLDIGYWGYQRYGRQDLRVTAVDVGQGAAHLLQLPGGFTVLVDGGGFSDNRVFDVGERILAPMLWQKKIKHVDLVILSHPNSDHLNGLLYILRHFDVDEIWSNGEPAGSYGYRQWQQIIRDKRIRHLAIETLTGRQNRQGVVFTILGPPEDFLARRSIDSWRDANNDSLVVHVRFEQVSLLFAGDIAAPAEQDMINRLHPDVLKSTILMVPHHGSRFSSSMPFLSAVAPREAIVSTGWQNRFGFPHPKVLDRLAKINARVWNTSHCGAVQIITDGSTYRVHAFRPVCNGVPQ